MGYRRAGFDVVGVDLTPQPRYPFPFIQADALAVLDDLLAGAATYPQLRHTAVLHASPPCQAYSVTRSFVAATGNKPSELRLIEPTRERMIAANLPYVIENVIGSPLNGVTLCGSSFGMRVRRHRLFESNVPLTSPPCRHKEQGRPVGVYGHGQLYWKDGVRAWRNVTKEEASEVMGIDWMNRRELSLAIPPTYTEWVGGIVMSALHVRGGLSTTETVAA